MFKRIHFPPEAIDDVRELVSLSDAQLQTLATLLNSKDATPPVKLAFVKAIETRLKLDSENSAESVARLATVLQGEDLDATQAAEVVDDLKTLVTQEVKNSADLLQSVESKRVALAKVIQRQTEVSRQLKLKRMAAGTQPAIKSVRTLVQLRPYFKRDEESGEPKSIECMVPAMTLELSFKKDDRAQSATFSLDEETLSSLIKNLQHAQLKWQMLNEEYSSKVCK